MQRISGLLRRYNDEPAWIFGKGPSLDFFDFAKSGTLRLCINESAKAVPSPTYFFAHDEGPIQNMAADWPVDCAAILQPVRAEFAAECGVPQDAIYTYEKRQIDNTLRDADPKVIAERNSLYGNSGTVHSAIHFCRLIGVSHITMVGFDGAGGYAKIIDLPPGGAAHERIRRDSISLLETMGFDYEFFTVESEHAESAS